MNSIRSFLAAIPTFIASQFSYWKEVYVFPPLSILFVALAFWIVPFFTGRHAVDDPGSIIGDCLTLAGLMIRVTAVGLIMSHIIGYKCETVKRPENPTNADKLVYFLYATLDSICVLFVLYFVLHYRPA